MNRKALVKISVGLVLFTIILFSFLVIFNSKFIKAEDKGETYNLGEKIKISLDEFKIYENVKLKIKTPSTEYIAKLTSSSFLFKPEEVGSYYISISDGETTKELRFLVVINASQEVMSDLPAAEVIEINNKNVSESETTSNNKGLKIINYSNEVILVNRDVVWKESIDSSDSDKKVKLPKFAKNVSLYELDGNRMIEKSVKIESKSFISNIIDSIFSNEEDYQYVKISKSDNLNEIEYVTSGPVSSERDISLKEKNVKVVSPAGIDYLNVIAYTNISENVKISEKNKIKIYWKEENTYLDFNAYDLNNNGFIDYVDWVIPHLSEQNFQIIIITKAEHLDENLTYLEDLFENVSQKDNVFAEIPSSHYLRVTFENLLDKNNDITLYAKGNASKVEIYQKDSNEKIAEINNITNYGKYSAVLSNLTDKQNVFDLKILENNLQIDQVIDPMVRGTVTLTFSDSVNNTAYSLTNGNDGVPPAFTFGWGGTQLNTNNYGAIATNNNSGFIFNSGAGNIEAYTRFNFTINATPSSINWIQISMKQRESSAGQTQAAEHCYYYVANFSAGAWFEFGTLMDGTTYTTRTVNLTAPDDFMQSNRLSILSFGSSLDAGEGCDVDYVEVRYNYNYSINDAPNDTVTSINSSEGTNYSISNLNCFSTITDFNNDKMNVSVRWYKNSALNLSMDYNNSYNNGTIFNSILSYRNLTVGDTWKCSLRLFDGTNYSSWSNSTNLTILAAPPLIQNTTCFDGSSWSSCSNIGWGMNIYVRTNCSSQVGGSVGNVTFSLVNIEDNKLYFNQTVTSQTSGYWEYNSGLSINDSGTFNLHSICRENPTTLGDLNWSVAWGNLSLSLINPVNSTNVSKGYFFNFTTQVECIGGECGNVNATLDPISFVRSGGVGAGTSFSFDIDSPNNRLVVVSASDESSGTNLTGVSVDGKACIRIAVADNSLSGTNHQEMWYCDEDNLGSSSETVTVAVTGGDASWAVHAHLYTGVSQNGPASYGINQSAVGGTSIIVRNINVSRFSLVVAGWAEGNGGYSIVSQTSPLTTRQDGPDPSSADLFTSSGIESSDQRSKNYSVTLSAAMNRGTGIVASWDSVGGIKGIIPMTPGTTPFYTTSMNPMNYSGTNCLASMINGSSCNVTWSVNTTGTANTTWEFFAYANSTNYINVTSGISRHINITILEVDFIPPIIYNITPLTGSYINSNPVILAANTNENANCQYSNSFTFNYGSGTDFTTGQGTTYHSVNLGSLSDGTYAYYIKCGDLSGNNNSNVNQNSTSFTIDTVNPLVTILSPQNIGYNTSFILFNFTLNEAGTCIYTLNRGITNYSMTANPARDLFNATNSSISDGQYTVYAYCNDSAGNRNYSTNQTFFKDTTPPNASLISPTNGSISNNPAQNLTVNLTDNLALVNTTLFIYNETSLINQTTAVVSGTQTLLGIVYNFLYDGIFRWFYNVYDIGGNLFTTNNNTITIDALPPRITINYPINESTLADVTPLLNISLEDNVNSLWYSTNNGVTNITICNLCGGVRTTFVYFNESNRTIIVYANNTYGLLSSNTTSFRIYMNHNSYDTFNDNSSILSKTIGTNWQTGNVSFSSVVSSAFWDNFEGTLAKWDGNGATAWDLSAIYNHTTGGLQGVRANNGNEADITTDNIDTSQATSMNISIWYYPIALEDADIDVYFYNGTTYNLIDNIGADGVQNQWNSLEFEVTDSQYFKSNFRLRFNAVLGAGETFGLDDVNITFFSSNGNSNNFTAYPINTTEPIMEFSKISWVESGTDPDNNISVQVSANHGTNWYNATNGNGIFGIQNGSSLIYRVLSATTSVNPIYLLDMNITWSNTTSAAPRIIINTPRNNTSVADVTPTLNVTLTSNANTLWYSINNGNANLTLCTDCTGTITQFLYLKESNFTVRVYANNSLGSISSNMSTFSVNMNYNYFDTFGDNSSISSKTEGVSWQWGNVSFVPSSSTDFSDNFEGTLAKWDGNGATAWDLNTTYNHTTGGLQGVRANNGNEADITTDNIDTSKAAKIKISFWYYPINLEDADADTIVYNGFAYRTIDNFGTDGVQNQWNYKEYNLTDSQYFVSNFRLRFNANLGANEMLAVDDVVVTVYNSLTEYGTSGNFTSYSINVTQPIREIINVTWLESGALVNNSNKSISVKLSANDGLNWYNATNGRGISNIQNGTNLTYRVFFTSNDSYGVTLLDMNITWANRAYPTVSIIYPINTNYTLNVSNINYTVTDSIGVDSCWYSNSTWNSTAVSAGINFTEVTSREGNNTWIVYCNNTEGNVRGSSVYFIKDTLGPNGTLNIPINGSFRNNATQNLTANATDIVGLRNATLFVYNSTNSLVNQTNLALTGTNAFIGIVYNFLYDGLFQWFYRFVDLSGNTFFTQNNTITIDRASPNVSILYPQAIVYSNYIDELNYSYFDTNPEYCWYSNNSGVWNSTAVSAGINFTSIVSFDGSNTWTVYCNDSANNLKTTSVTFFVNTLINPLISFVNNTYNDGTITSSTSIPINVSISEFNLTEVKLNWNWTNITIYNSSLIAMYNFDNRSSLGEGSTTNLTYDSSMFKHNGLCSGMGAGCNYTLGKYGKGIYFGGTNDYINISGVNSVSKSYTISMWAKSTLNNVQMHLFDSQGRLVLAWRSDSNTLGFFDTSWKHFGATPNDGNWHHLALVLDNSSTSATMYLDGVQSGATAIYSTNLNITGNVILGSNSSTNSNFFIGGMDEVRVWDRALSDVEVYEMYSSNLLQYTPIQWYLTVNQSRNISTVLGDGLYSYSSSAKNSIGNENSTEIRNITIDSGKPLVNIIYPQNISYTINITEINYSYFDTNPGYCWYSNNSGVRNSTAVLAGINFTNVNSVDGTNNWTLYCNDSSGNLNFSRVVFFRHILPPNGTLNTPVNNSFRNNITQNLTVNATDLVGLSNVTLFVYNSSNDLINQTNAIATGTTAFIGIVYNFLYDGVFQWFYRIVDAGSYQFFTQNNTITIDTVNPLVTIVHPENTTYGSGRPIFFNFTLNEAGTCIYTLNGGLTNYSMTTNSSRTWFTALNGSMADGSYTVTAYCNDTAGNKNYTESISFGLNSTAPRVSVISPLNQIYGISALDFNVTLDETGDTCKFSTNNWNFNYTMTQYNLTYYNYTNSSVNDGNYLARFWCNDTLGNVNSTATVNFTVDTTYPLISFGARTAVDSANLSQNYIFVNVTVTEANLANITYELYNLTSIINSTTFYNRTYFYNFSNLSEGYYYYNVTITDIVNQRNSTPTYSILLDRTAPNATLDVPINSTITNVTAQNLTVNISDNFGIRNATLNVYNSSNSRINQTTQIISGGTSAAIGIVYNFLYDGIFRWFYSIYDYAGNLFSTENNTITIDTNPPKINVLFPINKSYNYDITEINFTIIDLNTDSCWYSLNGGSNVYVSCNQNITGLTALEGLNLWTIYANDTLGYVNSTNITFIKDTVNPLVSILSPLNITYGNFTIFFNFTMNEAGTCTYSLDGGSTNKSMTANSSRTGFTASNATMDDGIYTVNAYCNDTAGNRNESVSVIFRKDTVSPIVNIISPLNQIYTNPSIDFNISLNKVSDMCRLTLDNWNFNYTMTQYNLTYYNYTNSSVNDGNYLARFWCNDTLGNVNSTATVNFTVDTTYPLISFGARTAVNGANLSSNYIFVNVTVTEANLANITYELYNLTSIINSTTFYNRTYFYNFSNLSEGYYYYNVTITDIVNQRNSTPTYSILLDRTAPNATLDVPINSTITNVTAQNLTVNISDNFGIRNATLNVYNSSNSLINQTTQVVTGGTTAVIGIVYNFLYDGVFRWFYSIYDYAGNLFVTQNNTITIDSTRPRIILNTQNGSYFNSTSVFLNYTAIDNFYITGCDLYINGAFNLSNQSQMVSNVSNNFSLILLDGFYNWNVVCRDIAGNQNTSETRWFTVDTTKPLIDLLYPNKGEIIFTNNVTFNFTVSDNLDMNLSCNLTVDSIVKSSFYALNGTVTSKSVLFNSGDQFFWNVTCTDDTGNTNTSENRNFTIAFAPIVNLTTPINYTYTNVTPTSFYYNASDFNNNIVNSTLIINDAINMTNQSAVLNGQINNFTLTLTDGIYNWTVNVTDATNLRSSDLKRVIIIDTHAPLINLYNPLVSELLGWNNVTFNLSASDNIDANFNCSLNVNGINGISNFTQVNGTNRSIYYALNDGNYSWNISCFDRTGNLNFSLNSNFTVEAPPNVTLVSPQNGNLFNFTNISFVYLPQDAIGFTNCSLFIDGIFNVSSNSILSNQNNSFNVSNIPDGYHNYTVECIDAAPDYNVYRPSVLNFTVDRFAPVVTLLAPPNNTNVLRSVNLNFTVTDNRDNNLTCNLYIDNNLNITGINATNGTITNLTVSGLSLGNHNWNVSCMDSAFNVRYSSNWIFNVTLADLAVYSSEIVFNTTSPKENESVTINATIHQLINVTITNITVKFYNGDPTSSGVQIGNNITISILNGSSNQSVGVTWNVPVGGANIFVLVDPPISSNGFIEESNESNNVANSSVIVSGWHFVFGDVNANSDFELSNNIDKRVIIWPNISSASGNIYVADLESYVRWTNLQALGVNRTGQNRSADFTELDTMLNMSNFVDSITRTYTNNSVSKNLSSYYIFNRLVNNVSIAESINNTNFYTGILWDTTSDTDGHFGVTNHENVVFFARTNPDQIGAYGIYDYEIRIPAKLRSYVTTDNTRTVFYSELY